MPQVSDFTVGWICALYKEYIAARYALDEIYEDEGEVLKATGDNNKYIRGRIGCHHVVVTCLPAGSIGLVSASTVVTSMRSTFPSIRFAFMVGIAGGSPRPSIDVRLGDVIIGTKVIPYRSGKETPHGFERTGDGVRPHHILRSYVNDMKYRADVELDLEETVEQKCGYLPKKIQRDFRRPDNSLDRLYQPRYLHNDSCDCVNTQPRPIASLVSRQPRELGSRIVVHLGSIASGDAVIKDAKIRDTWAKELNTLCFEMESAGFENIGFIAIRGICDYADSHKNDQWHGYAAMSAAVCAAEFLKTIPAHDVSGSQMTITSEEIERFVAPAINELKEAIHGCVTLANHEEAISKIEETLKDVDQRYLVLNHFETSIIQSETSIRHNDAAIKTRLADLEFAHGNLEGAMKKLAESILQQKNESMSQETKQAWENLHETVTDRSERFRQGATFLAGTLEITAGALGDISSTTKNPNLDLASKLTKRAGEFFQGLGNNNEKEKEHGTENSKRHFLSEVSNKAEKFTDGLMETWSKPRNLKLWKRNSERPGSQAGDLQEERQSRSITENLIDLNDKVDTHNSSGLGSTMPSSLTGSQSCLSLSPTSGPQKPSRPFKPARFSSMSVQPSRTVSHVRNTSRFCSPNIRNLEETHSISPVSTGGSSHVTTESRASHRGENISRLVQNLEQNGPLSNITRGTPSNSFNRSRFEY